MKVVEKKSLENNVITKSNTLVEALYRMSIKEIKIFEACLSMVDSRDVLDKEDAFVLTVEQALNLFYTESNRQNIYRDLKQACTSLFRREVTIKINDDETLLTRFVSDIKFNHKVGKVELHFAPGIIPFISQLVGNFTMRRLEHTKMLTSSYAYRLHEILTMWISHGLEFKELEIEEVKKLLSIEDRYYRFSQFKQKVIDNSIEQINKYTDINVEVSFLKNGRSYNWIQFHFHRKAEIARAEAAKAVRLERKEHNAEAKAKREKREAEEAVAAFRKRTEEEMNNYFSRYSDGAIFVERNGRKWEKAGSLLFTNREDGGTVAMQLKAAFAMINDYALFPLEFEIDSPEQQERERLEAEGQQRLFRTGNTNE